jgi:hypothetical protein
MTMTRIVVLLEVDSCTGPTWAFCLFDEHGARKSTGCDEVFASDATAGLVTMVCERMAMFVGPRGWL